MNPRRGAGIIAIALAVDVSLQWLIGLGPAAAFISTTGDNWVWLNPLPQGGSLGPVSCPTTSECLAAELVGSTILETTDAGNTWTAVNPWPSTSIGARALSGLDCANASTCVAVAGSWSLWSADGGRTWTQHFTSTQAFLFGVSCPTGSSCTAVGQNGTIVSTTDGGITWLQKSSGTTTDLEAVSCTGATCVATGPGGTIVNSSDGGNTWSVRASGTTFRLRGVKCPTELQCVAVGAAGTVLTTIDGGHSWTVRAAAGGTNLAVACSSSSSCVMVGNGTGEGAFASADGGATWLLITLGALNGVSCPSATTVCVAVGDNGVMIRSIDGGSTWMTLSSDPIVDGGRAVTCVVGGCVDVGYGGVATSSNGSVWTDRGGMSNLYGVSCVSIAFCVAVGRGNVGIILISVDGGASWSPPISGTPATGLDGVACPTSNTCVAVGAAGTIVTTTDAGQTWQSQSSGTPTDLNSVACGNAMDCIAVGLKGVILSSTDAGVHWTSHSAASFQDLFGVSCPTTLFCMAVGGAYALTSIDQFASVTQYLTPFDLNAVSCAAALACMAVGSNDAAKTYDGGSTWLGDAIGAVLRGVSCPSSCWAVGNPGNGSAILADSSRFTSIAQSSAPGTSASRSTNPSATTTVPSRTAVAQAPPPPPPLISKSPPQSPQPDVMPKHLPGVDGIGRIIALMLERMTNLLATVAKARSKFAAD